MSEKINVSIDANNSVSSELDMAPVQEMPLDEIVMNLGFWLSMVQEYGRRVAVSKFGKPDGVPVADPDSQP